MAKVKIKDDLALLLTSCIVAVVAWGAFHVFGRYVILFAVAVWMYIWVVHRNRVPKNMASKDTNGKE